MDSHISYRSEFQIVRNMSKKTFDKNSALQMIPAQAQSWLSEKTGPFMILVNERFKRPTEKGQTVRTVETSIVDHSTNTVFEYTTEGPVDCEWPNI